MLKILGSILAVSVIALSGYGVISQNFKFMSHLMLLLGALMLVSGLIELQEDRKRSIGYMFIVVSLFIFTVSIMDLL
ncbi:hypothetical protein AC622_10775 [Bacillus sp. FJAT-27916]|uniref:DUF3953 domain-containing protein n=1 Tax=Bacillus sp. FJAT-27916 TaxID=1679169 RepID=UPI000670B0F0|nr:DUF3953 domain-containing protein [Bacillus sp. FJAT-27916]KMY44668.1 hypothetical protein AC622_10775 [Bacillus sp. FJAT-27916]